MEREDELLVHCVHHSVELGQVGISPRCVQQGRAKLFLHLSSVRTVVYSSTTINCKKLEGDHVGVPGKSSSQTGEEAFTLL